MVHVHVPTVIKQQSLAFFHNSPDLARTHAFPSFTRLGAAVGTSDCPSVSACMRLWDAGPGPAGRFVVGHGR